MSLTGFPLANASWAILLRRPRAKFRSFPRQRESSNPSNLLMSLWVPAFAGTSGVTPGLRARHPEYDEPQLAAAMLDLLYGFRFSRR